MEYIDICHACALNIYLQKYYIACTTFKWVSKLDDVFLDADIMSPQCSHLALKLFPSMYVGSINWLYVKAILLGQIQA